MSDADDRDVRTSLRGMSNNSINSAMMDLKRKKNKKKIRFQISSVFRYEVN
jgi:hypothetical protein